MSSAATVAVVGGLSFDGLLINSLLSSLGVTNYLLISETPGSRDAAVSICQNKANRNLDIVRCVKERLNINSSPNHC